LFLTMAILLGLVAAFIELRTAFSVPFIRTLIEKFTIIGVVFSIALSVFIGAIFGAAGLVVMLGAMIATTITQPVYMVASKVKKTGHDVAHTVEEVRSVFRPFWNLFKLGAKIIALPFIIVFKVVKFIDSHTSNKPAHV